MVLTTRSFNPVPINEAALTGKGPNVLAKVSVSQMVGLLVQIGQVSEYAADVFQNLVVEANAIGDRITMLKENTTQLEAEMRQVDDKVRSNASVFYSTNADLGWKRNDNMAHSFFSESSRPLPIEKLRQMAYPPPNVQALNQLCNRDCLKLYTDPSFFFEQWQQEELAKLSGDKGGGKKRKKKSKKLTHSSAPVEVASINVKVYSGKGAEFGGPTVQSVAASTDARTAQQKYREQQQQQQQQQLNNLNTTATGGSGYNNYQARPQLVPQEQKPQYIQPQPIVQQSQPQHHQAPPAHVQVQSNDLYKPIASPQPIAPQPQQQQQQRVIPPPVQPVAPVVPAAPVNSEPHVLQPSTSPNVPTPPSLDTLYSDVPKPSFAITPKPAAAAPAKPKAPMAPGRDNLLSAITAGTALRKVKVEEKPKTQDERGGLLSDIKNRTFSLKKATPVEAPKPKQDDGWGAVMQIMARRKAIESSEEESGSDDWD